MGKVRRQRPFHPRLRQQELSPIEIMRQKAAEKAAAAAALASAAPATLPVPADGEGATSAARFIPGCGSKTITYRNHASEGCGESSSSGGVGERQPLPRPPSRLMGQVRRQRPFHPRLRQQNYHLSKSCVRRLRRKQQQWRPAEPLPRSPSRLMGKVRRQPPASPPAAAAKLSPIEIMRQKAAEKAAAVAALASAACHAPRRG
jgi:hypothetical protein